MLRSRQRIKFQSSKIVYLKEPKIKEVTYSDNSPKAKIGLNFEFSKSALIKGRWARRNRVPTIPRNLVKKVVKVYVKFCLKAETITKEFL